MTVKSPKSPVTTPGRPAACWPARDGTPWIDEPVGELLGRRARASANRPALYWLEHRDLRVVTYGELYVDAARCARGLAAVLPPGGFVAVCAPNSVEWVVLEYAAALAGVVLVPINPSMADPEIEHILRLTGAGLVLTVEAFRGQPVAARIRILAEALTVPVAVDDLSLWFQRTIMSPANQGPPVPPPSVAPTSLPPGPPVLLAPLPPGPPLPTVRPEDPFLVQYTSGTTGRPKGALHSHASAVNAAATWVADWDHSPDDVLVAPVPLHHVGASITGLLGCLATGSALGLLPDYDPGAIVELLRRSHATVLAAVPTMLFDLQRLPGFDVSALTDLRIVVGGGAAVPASTVARIEADFGARFVVSYGQSESPAILQTPAADSVEVKATTLGRPLPGRAVRIARRGGDGDEGSEGSDAGTAELDEIGEICVRTRTRMSEYLHQPEATAEVIDSDGWLHTGDLGAMDERGYVSFHGRARDVIIRGGENLYPGEIEAVLAEHPAVAAVAMVGAPDERWGEVPVAFVQLTQAAASSASGASSASRGGEGAAEGQLRESLEAHGRARLASFKVPRRWFFVEAMPMTASGKIRKVELRERLTDQ